MAAEKYKMRRFFLRFHDDSIEAAYLADILHRTRVYYLVTWASIIFFGSLFYFLDHSFFKENAHIIIVARISLLAFAAFVVGASFLPQLKKYMKFSPALFTVSTGTFCILQIGLSDPTEFTPYLAGLFFAYAGAVFSTVGAGFTAYLVSLIINLVFFEITVGVIWPADHHIFLVYNFFVVGIMSIFLFAAFLTERTFRQSFVIAAQLRDSLEEVKKLSGLLPICATCKKIRDDKGYWSEVELYISKRTEAQFSHGICPGCAERLFPDYTSKTTESDAS